MSYICPRGLRRSSERVTRYSHKADRPDPERKLRTYPGQCGRNPSAPDIPASLRWLNTLRGLLSYSCHDLVSNRQGICVWQIERAAVRYDLDGLERRIVDHLAGLAVCEVAFELPANFEGNVSF